MAEDSGGFDVDCVAAVLVTAAVLVVVGGVAWTAAAPAEEPEETEAQIPAATEGPTPVPYDEVDEEWQPDRGDLNLTKVERLVVEEANEVRMNHSLEPLEHRETLSEPAREHAVNMSELFYIGHFQPDGEGPEERYFDACDDLRGGMEEFELAENAAHAWYKTLYEPTGWNETAFATTEEHVADLLVNEWMESPDHREALLDDRWRTTGVGAAISVEEGAVFAAQAFCTAG